MYDYDKMLTCIRCGATDHLIKYQVTRLTDINYKVKFSGSRKMKYYFETAEVPVCQQCYRAFRSWEKYNAKKRFSNLCIAICGFIVIILVCYIFIHDNVLGVQHLWNIVAFLVIVAIIASIYSLIILFNAKKMDSNPWKYVKIKGHQKIFIKPFNSSVWIPYNMWIRASLTERMLEEKAKLKDLLCCEKCGSEIKRDDEYCMNCGTRIPK